MGNPRKPSPTKPNHPHPAQPAHPPPLLLPFCLHASRPAGSCFNKCRRSVNLCHVRAATARDTNEFCRDRCHGYSTATGRGSSRGVGCRGGVGCLTYWLLRQQMTAIRLSPNLIVDAAWEINSNWLKRDERAVWNASGFTVYI